MDDGRRPLRGTKLLYAFWLKASGGESDLSERPEAQSPIIQKNWNQNEQASGRPIKTKMYGISPENAILFFVYWSFQKVLYDF
jgi:hypothetical protein